jgi:hypothetical protein
MADDSTAKIRANEIVLKDGTYRIKRAPESGAARNERFALDVESKDGGTMHISDLTVRCLGSTFAVFKSKHSTFHGTNKISVENDSTITIASDKLSVDEEPKTVFQIEKGSGEILFDTYSGDSPFDFDNNSYPRGLFNFIKTDGKTGDKNMTSIRIFGVHAFQRQKMEDLKVVAIDGVALDQWKNVVDYHQNGNYLIISLKQP